MRLDWKSLLSLRTQVLAIVVIFWNAGFLLAMRVGGDIPRGMLTAEGKPIVVATCALAAVFALLVASSGQVRKLVLEPERADRFRAWDFYFFAVVVGLLAVGNAFMPVATA